MDIREVKNRAFSVFSSNPAFQGTGIGQENGIELIFVYWSDDMKNKIDELPKELEGVKLKHIITGVFKPF